MIDKLAKYFEVTRDVFMLRLVKFVAITLTLLLTTGCAIFQCPFFKHYPQDNILEEALEEKIKEETGVDIDLTPMSKEEQ